MFLSAMTCAENGNGFATTKIYHQSHFLISSCAFTPPLSYNKLPSFSTVRPLLLPYCAANHSSSHKLSRCICHQPIAEDAPPIRPPAPVTSRTLCLSQKYFETKRSITITDILVTEEAFARTQSCGLRRPSLGLTLSIIDRLSTLKHRGDGNTEGHRGHN